MKISRMMVLAAFVVPALIGSAAAQTAKTLPAQHYYYDDYEWPLPAEGTTTMTLNGMKSVHIVWMTQVRSAEGKPLTDSAVITLIEGIKTRFAPRGGCSFELELVNANPPVIRMNKPSQMCTLQPGGKVVFKVLAAP
jgi:hypothetical protein